MHDFNFYIGREVIAVLSSPGEVAKVIRQQRNGYVLIKDRDLKKLNMFGPEAVVVTGSVGSTTWHLVAFKAETGQ